MPFNVKIAKRFTVVIAYLSTINAWAAMNLSLTTFWGSNQPKDYKMPSVVQLKIRILQKPTRINRKPQMITISIKILILPNKMTLYSQNNPIMHNFCKMIMPKMTLITTTSQNLTKTNTLSNLNNKETKCFSQISSSPLPDNAPMKKIYLKKLTE